MKITLSLQMLALWCALLSLSIHRTECFAPPSIARQKLTTRTTDITRSPSTSLLADNRSRRREIFGWVKRSLLVATGYNVLRPQDANAVPAAEDAQLTGRIVTFEVANLNGDAGQKGTFKIQLAPEWAPKGVKRFEVRSKIQDLPFDDKTLCQKFLNDFFTGF
jgi:hypothetical protein